MSQLRDVVRLIASAARTTSGESAAMEPGYAKQVNVRLAVTAQSGTTPTLDVAVEWSFDNGTTWIAADAADAFTQIGATTPDKVKSFAAKAPLFRLKWTIAGTTPSYTFSADVYLTD